MLLYVPYRTMNTTTATHPLPPHPNPVAEDPKGAGGVNHKSLLNILNTKCSNSLQNLKQAHSIILRTGHSNDNYVAGTLIKCYSNTQFEALNYALKVFDELPKPNVFVYNFIIKGCLDNNEAYKAVVLYFRMVAEDSRPNKFTYPAVFKACAEVGCVEEGMQVHGHVAKLGLRGEGHVKSAGIQMYSRLGKMVEAERMLKEGVGEADVVCWNVLLDGWFRCGDAEAASALFEQMKEDRSVGSWNAMITGYARCGQIESARACFDEMSVKDEISWSAMIDGYVKGGWFKEALGVFEQMQSEGVEPGKHVLSSVLAACANIGALDQGRWVHTYAKRNNIRLESVLGTALVDMYAKCGRLDMAWEVFENMRFKEVHSWNAMIGGLAIHGRGDDCIDLFYEMCKAKVVKPDKVTLVAVLKGCAHAGLVSEGLEIFESMKETHGVEAEVEHYGCVVDLLGRAGMLGKAENVINSMPMNPNAAVWGALLGACRIHGDLTMGEQIGKLLLDMEPDNSGRYSLLSNIYAKAGKWEDVAQVRKLMKSRGLKTNRGKSVIEMEGVTHEFVIGDGSHVQKKEIYSSLEKIIERLKLDGYSPDTSDVLFDIEEEEKETTVRYHSEKIAVAFGIMNSVPGETIRIIKNLRMCEDCHTALKLVSRVYGRELIIRDRVRYHHFSKGNCSCKDYW
ncbi:unnamed protein product [Rhodiola kirilowii]